MSCVDLTWHGRDLHVTVPVDVNIRDLRDLDLPADR